METPGTAWGRRDPHNTSRSDPNARVGRGKRGPERLGTVECPICGDEAEGYIQRVLQSKCGENVKPRGYDATMRRGVRGHPLSIRDRLRNKRINKKRAPGERPFAVLKRVFDAGHFLVTTVPWVHVKMVFACLCFNLLQLGTLAARP